MIFPSGILDKVEPPSVEPPSSGGEGGKVCNCAGFRTPAMTRPTTGSKTGV